jgi:hypothetical protein
LAVESLLVILNVPGKALYVTVGFTLTYLPLEPDVPESEVKAITELPSQKYYTSC